MAWPLCGLRWPRVGPRLVSVLSGAIVDQSFIKSSQWLAPRVDSSEPEVYRMITDVL